MNKFLIVVDMQNDFVTGSLGSEQAQLIVANVKEKILKYSKENYKIIFTRDTHYENYLDTAEGKKLPVKHCINETYGWQIVDSLDKLCDCEYVNKLNFGYLDWSKYISDFDKESKLTIELVGVCTDICVVANALILRTAFPDAEIIVDSSCCAGTSVEAHNAALLTMKSCQIDVV